MLSRRLSLLAEIAIFSALGLILDKLVLFTMPQGGSVSLVMLPILLVALRHGLMAGLLTGGIVGTIQLFYGGYFLNVFQVFLDYALSYAGIGLAGLLAPLLTKQKDLKQAAFTISLAGFLGGGVRLLATFLSGIIFYADYTPAGTPVWLYSFTYNISYILPSTLLACLLLTLLYKAQPNFFKK
ncbi:TPA: energy-coupled thiamine transporter ThiT [Streptococcus suis]|nr:energy-coupled thiamine transporter ThiT [Streptococcus suis]